MTVFLKRVPTGDGPAALNGCHPSQMPRTLENMIASQQRNNGEGNTSWNRMEVVEQNEHRSEFRITYCMFHDFYSRMVIPELTTIGCSFDNIFFNSYLPEEISLHRNGIGNRITEGAPACHFLLEYRSRQ